jgi:hypothetical protein
MGQEETVTPRAAGERNENYDVEALDEIIWLQKLIQSSNNWSTL